jgi:molybdopterin-guanine dinucleotide biosynthesis protein B
MKKLAVAFTGPSNSGKTTLIIKLSEYLQKQGNKVCIIKHDPKDKARFDKEGKDSYKFSQTKADVAVVSPNKTTMFKQSTSSIDDMVNMFGEFDYLLVEGLKTLPLPRIAIFRNEINEDYLCVSDVIATDETISSNDIPNTHEHLDLNDTAKIAQWINQNAKKF